MHKSLWKYGPRMPLTPPPGGPLHAGHAAWRGRSFSASPLPTAHRFVRRKAIRTATPLPPARLPISRPTHAASSRGTRPALQPCFGPDAVLMALFVAGLIGLAYLFLLIRAYQLLDPRLLPGSPH